MKKSGQQESNTRNDYERRKRSEARDFWGVIAVGALAISAVGYGLFEAGEFAYNHLIKYRPGREIPESIAANAAQSKFAKAFSRANPAEKFTIQFLDTEFFDSTRYPNPQGLFPSPPVWESQYNNSCLAKSAYAINGGHINAEASGLFSYVSVSANLPAAAAYAEVNPSNSNQLIVESGHSNSINLVFNGVESGTALVPANSSTINILQTYGCQTGRISTYSTNNPQNQN